MKKLIFLIATILLIASCKSETKTEQVLIRGEFILIDDAGVIKGKDFIYGVVVNDMAKELNKKIKPLQREEFDMVPVVIKGIIKPNTNEGWPEVVEIKEIVGVTQPTSELPTKIKSSDSTEQTTQAGHEGHDH